MSGVNFELTIRLGDMISFAGFLIVGVSAFYNIKTTLGLFGLRLDMIDASIEDLQRDVKDGTTHEHRIVRLEKDTERHAEQIHELQRGQGYVREKFSKSN
jgi:hypothetical protein